MSVSYKIVVIGAGGVGKSCFTIQLISGKFVETYDPTLEDSYRKHMTVDNEEAVLNIYDTAGQEDFLAVRDQYIRIGEGFVCMYSVTVEASFNEIKTLREKIITLTDNEKLPCILVGNKCDLVEDREVQTSAGEKLAQEFHWKFLEASAKSRINVTQSFEEIVRSIREYRSMNDTKQVTKDEKPLQKSKTRRGPCVLV